MSGSVQGDLLLLGLILYFPYNDTIMSNFVTARSTYYQAAIHPDINNKLAYTNTSACSLSISMLLLKRNCGAGHASNNFSALTHTDAHTVCCCWLLMVALHDVFMQMGITTSWEWMPPDVVGEVMEQLKWERRASAGAFRRVCNAWQDAHDQRVRHLSVNARLSVNGRRFNYAQMMSCFILRFQRVQQIDVCGDSLYCSAVAEVGSGANKWLQALAGLTALTSLNLRGCSQVSANGLRALGGLTSLTSLNLRGCSQVSDNGLRALGGLTSLISLNLYGCERVSDDGLRALAGLTALTSLNLGDCIQVSGNGLQTLASLTALTSLNLEYCQGLSDDGLQALAGLTALTYLDLEGSLHV
jgi:hypothetical protein